MPERKDVLPLALYALDRSNPYSDLSAWDVAIESDLITRAETGKSKYGVALQVNNGRNSLMDLYEEMLDAYMYATQYREENRTTPGSMEVERTIRDALRIVANQVATENSSYGFLGAFEEDNIGADNRRQIEEYADYKDAYRSLPPQQHQED